MTCTLIWKALSELQARADPDLATDMLTRKHANQRTEQGVKISW